MRERGEGEREGGERGRESERERWGTERERGEIGERERGGRE